MKTQEGMLRAMAKQITWLQAAEIAGLSDRHMRRLCWRYETYGYDGWGNRTAERVTLGSGYPFSVIANANNQLSNMSYDAAGQGVAEGVSCRRMPEPAELQDRRRRCRSGSQGRAASLRHPSCDEPVQSHRPQRGTSVFVDESGEPQRRHAHRKSQRNGYQQDQPISASAARQFHHRRSFLSEAIAPEAIAPIGCSPRRRAWRTHSRLRCFGNFILQGLN